MELDFNSEFAGPQDYANFYRKLGIQAVPARTPREGGAWKRPAINWRQYTQDLVEIDVFQMWPWRGANVGMITGVNKYWVLDADTQRHPEAAQWLARVRLLHNNNGDFQTPTQRTGGGGLQLLFLAPDGWTPPTIKTPIGIDIRGVGGFAMLPPSMHESGQLYEWLPGFEPWETNVLIAPQGLNEEIDALCRKYGAGTGASNSDRAEKAPTPQYATTPFGLVQDGREDLMTRRVWAAVVNWRRDCPIPPTQGESGEKAEAVFQSYLDAVAPQQPIEGVPKADLLEREGRGFTLFREKWQAAMRQWDTKVRRDADVPPEAVGPSQAEPPKILESDDDQPFRASDLQGDPPERKWLVDQWIPAGVVTSLYGDGGLGKTLLAQQLACALSVGGQWLGFDVPKTTVLAVLCEDERDELHRRQNDIKAAMGYPIGNPFDNLWLWPRLGRDNTLVRWNRDGVPTLTVFGGKLKDTIELHQPEVLILDTLADFYAGSEIDRSQVNHFVKSILGAYIEARRARSRPLSIILLGHPSVTGKASGSGYSGSTAWNAAVRSRLYLTRDDAAPSDERLLTRGKANYASSGEETTLRLIYGGGVLQREEDADDGDSILWVAQKEVASQVQRAWQGGQPYSNKKGHQRYIYDALPPQIQGGGFTPSVVRQAIREAIEDNAIIVAASNGRRGFKLPGKD